MKRSRTPFIVAIAALALVLAACGQPQDPPVLPEGFVSIQLGLDGSSLSGQALVPQGSPYEPTDGSIAVAEAQVSVFDAGANLVTFDHNPITNTYTQDAGGTVTHVSLTPATDSANVVLSAAGNPYTFETLGFDAATNVIAYDSQSQNLSADASVMVTLSSVLGDAVLTPRLPTTVATPGQLLDLMLVVMANGNTTFPTDYLQVPIGDFTASYGPLANASEVGHSNRGIRVTVAADCSTSITVDGTVAGLLDNSGTYAPGTIDMSGAGGYELSCPAPVNGTIAVDLEAPSVTLDTYDNATLTVTGTADDNYGIAKVQIFDGPILVASTDSAEAIGDVADIAFTAATTSYSATLSVTPTGGLTVLALDASGNESSADDPNFIYVDASNSSGTEDGSQAHPFDTIQEGLDAVVAGGTVFVMDGTYSGDSSLSLAKSLRLVGQSEMSVQVQLATVGYGVTVSASNVTLENLTIEGTESSSSLSGNYGIKVFSSAGPVTNFKMTNATVKGFGRSEIDLNTVDGATFTNVTADGEGTAGVGVGVSGSANVTFLGIHTTGNAWGGVGLFSTNVGTINSVSNVHVDSTSSFDEARKVYSDNETGQGVSGLTLDGFAFSVENPDQRSGVCPVTDGRGEDFVDYLHTEAEAIALSVALCNPQSSYIQTVSHPSGVAVQDNHFVVGQGMSIQPAIDASSAGATIDLTAGTFDAGFTVANKDSLTIGGAGATTIIEPMSGVSTGVAHKSTDAMDTVIFVDHSTGITLRDMAVTTGGLDWSSALDAIVFWNASTGEISGLQVDGSSTSTLTGVQTGQGLAVDASNGETTTLDITNTDFAGWNKNAVDIVDGNGPATPGAGGTISVNVHGGTFTGAGGTGVLAQNAIVYWERSGGTVTGTVDGVTIQDLNYTGPADADAAGILPVGTVSLPTISNSVFTDVQTYISNNTPDGIDAGNNTFDGVSWSTADSTQREAIEARVFDAADDSAMGEVTIH